MNFRPEYRPPWHGRPYDLPVVLDPLGAEAQQALITDLIGADPSLGALPARLRERTRGNPFFLEEVVQSLVERGLLVGRRGAYELVDPAAAIEIPPTLQAVLSARIDRLGETDKHVLQSAAVIGKRVRESVLQAVAEASATAVSDALARLMAGGFVDVEHAVALLRAFDTYRVVEPQVRGSLAETYAALGQATPARAESERAVAAAVRGGPHLQAEALLSRAHVLLALDGFEGVHDAMPLLTRATSLWAGAGARRQAPVLAEARARIGLARGEPAAFGDWLAEARRLYLSLDLPRQAARLDRWRTAPTR